MTKKTSYVYCLPFVISFVFGASKIKSITLKHEDHDMYFIFKILIYHLWHKEPEVILLMYHPKHLQYFQLLSVSIRVFSTDKNKMNTTVIHLYYDNFLNIIFVLKFSFTIYQENDSHTLSVHPSIYVQRSEINQAKYIFQFYTKFSMSQNLEVRVNTAQGHVLFVSSHLRKRFLSGQDLTKEQK